MTLKRIALAVLAGLAAVPVFAKEGPDQYPNGVENFMSGALPPPGDYFLNYLGHYNGRLRDSHGNKLPVSVNATFDALRWVHMSDLKVFGADWGWHMIVPIVHQSMHTPGGSGTADGLGDITVDPFILAWHFPNFHVAAAVDINLPTGKYDKDDPTASIGANYWSFEPLLAMTYLSDGGFEASAKLMYNMKTRNNDTKYQSGDEFHMDYTLAQHVGDWAFGLGGYYLKQTTDDEQYGDTVGDGNRGQVFAWGPQIKYDYKGMSFIATWNIETQAENRFEGDKVWLKFVTRF
ncbi:SphA family protein [Plasticicumulans acidivorans]|uniref:Outer membrane beta-barrel porin/alpha-amylase n=1 Tax=Plasticicumulans acidivorans TaxID=886464 RepID=A0A317MS78_9GAMM|nr:transporter [Plasticicumulans acidivorans]PWV59851.1 hypothetical protein C7443_109104 [Plasticicumulans acidivorans]